MAKLETIIARSRTSSMSIDKLCKIKTYLPTKEKFDFLKEYDGIIQKHIQDHVGFEEFVKLIFFNLMIVKKYTDIEIEFEYEEFDKLQAYGIIASIANQIGADYELMMSLVKIKDMQ